MAWSSSLRAQRELVGTHPVLPGVSLAPLRSSQSDFINSSSRGLCGPLNLDLSLQCFDLRPRKDTAWVPHCLHLMPDFLVKPGRGAGFSVPVCEIFPYIWLSCFHMVSLSFQVSQIQHHGDTLPSSPQAQKPALLPCEVSSLTGARLGLLQQKLNEWLVQNVGASGCVRTEGHVRSYHTRPKQFHE